MSLFCYRLPLSYHSIYFYTLPYTLGAMLYSHANIYTLETLQVCLILAGIRVLSSESLLLVVVHRTYKTLTVVLAFYNNILGLNLHWLSVVFVLDQIIYADSDTFLCEYMCTCQWQILCLIIKRHSRGQYVCYIHALHPHVLLLTATSALLMRVHYAGRLNVPACPYAHALK